ncbi:aldehyde dehydrogenase family protein [Thauera sp.]|jgi:acyl-CoA reductase-like NAD-dependent aldehyde dehydrogenase|uniref:aldehyde dehydrogenase family protein n=1 Tax=Thauera sp. TaxID=1905334 RepID=UPI001A4381E2|nr:aldehyde dehydrogenase family protein [Thauera sp.]MBL8464074.1 aldehyde dehydrogenase family protein [Thauera sp.]HRO34985.1 aldehyde dehydrogenase family protein [Thauera sp.]
MNKTPSLVIDGRKVAGDRGTLPVIDPALGEAFAECPNASPAQLDEAVAAAGRAFALWQHSSCEERRSLLEAIAARIEQNAPELAEIIVREQGKPLALAHVEVGGAVAWTRATAALELPVELIEDRPGKRIELHRRPLGVVGSITPWNWPLMIAVWHIMPALRAGNAVVIKPSELTPLNTLRLVELIDEVAPPGLVNAVAGGGALGREISGHPGIQKIVFTGSTRTGQDIMRNAADTLKRLTLELGGNDAGIVLPGTDIGAIAEGVFGSAFLNMGQTCAALKRLYVHESQYEDMCRHLVAIAARQKVGNGLDEGTSFGPIQNRDQFERVCELVEDARAAGARILCGGEPLPGKGYFYPPTLVADIADGTRLVDEEQFGPVLPVIRYRDVDEAVRLANASTNGLGGSVWSGDPEAARAVANRLECGTVWINGHAEVLPHCPFGGCKMSGFGVEFGLEGLLEYTRPQLLNINLPTA